MNHESTNQVRKCIQRLRENVIDAFDWAYVECNLNPDEPDLKHDVQILVDYIERGQHPVNSPDL